MTIDSKEIAKKALGCVEFKVNFAGLGEIVIDDVIEAALDKIVADSTNPFDNAAKNLLWPILEKEAKALLAVKAVELEEAIKKFIAEQTA
jgi:hypothetical protein